MNTEVRSKVNILLVDDQPARLLSYEAILQDLGQNLVTARSGLEALERLMQQEFAVVLLDVSMPGMDGFETAERLERASGAKHSAILALTGNADLRDAALRDPRFTASLLKPADPGRLLVLLSSLVPRH